MTQAARIERIGCGKKFKLGPGYPSTYVCGNYNWMHKEIMLCEECKEKERC